MKKKIIKITSEGTSVDTHKWVTFQDVKSGTTYDAFLASEVIALREWYQRMEESGKMTEEEIEELKKLVSGVSSLRYDEGWQSGYEEGAPL